ncbi:YetF domain-containing protein [Clostridium ganghwense]|uniref:DUF421 domain-containing protein n=1 Tax=Clostridium ganghwense TaxID=312089 RepID=A0ABT4CN91_9CLOT|nr:DUF421 domain-containing protein [Clostridium ganghwense]MCY6369556.1 DUF421 domain-containing protein [Clostridium ganghwense]
MFIVMIRTAILYILVVLTMRLMGKRQIGELEPFELAIAIMISDLASLPMQDLGIPLLYGIIPIITLLILQTLITILELKSQFFRKMVSGKPSVIIAHGKIDIKELRNQRLTYNDLVEELRLKGFYNIQDIAFAVLETSGELSIIPKTDITSVTKKDLNIASKQDQLPITLILDGKIDSNNLKTINKDINWLNSQLISNNIDNPNKVFIAILDSQNKFFFQLKD